MKKTTGNAISSNIKQILKDLKNSRAVIIPMDKTNNFVAVNFEKNIYVGKGITLISAVSKHQEVNWLKSLKSRRSY